MKRILILEDVAETRRWLSQIACAAFPDASVVEADNLRAGLAAANDAPDLALIDLRLPDEPGIELLQRWLARGESTPVAILSASDSALEAQAALAAGALGFIPKSSDGNALRQAVTRVLLGETLPAPSSSSPLTPRQLEILQLLAEGLPNKAISRELGLAEDTVKTHLKALFETFAVHTRTACVSAARQRGWL